MVAEIVTKLPVYTWAKIVGLHPMHFMGVAVVDDGDSTLVCDGAWLQHDWQGNGRASRDSIARAIRQAEDDIESLLSYRLLPAWEVDEWHETIRPWRPETFNLNGRDIRGQAQHVEANWKHFISGGQRAQTLIEAAAAVTYASNVNFPPETYDIDAEVAVAVAAGVQPCEVAVYYPGHAGDERWRISPVTVSIVAGVATITFRREQAVVEEALESLVPGLRVVDPLDDANFLDEVDVYRVYNDPQAQATLMWPDDCGPPGTYATQSGALGLRSDPAMALVTYGPAAWDAVTSTFTAQTFTVRRNPDIVRLWYRAGLQDQRKACPALEMNDDWARTVAIYATALLEGPPCGCGGPWFEHWQQDMAFASGAEELASYQIAESDLRGRFGTRRGAIYALRRVYRPNIVAARSLHSHA